MFGNSDLHPTYHNRSTCATCQRIQRARQRPLTVSHAYKNQHYIYLLYLNGVFRAVWYCSCNFFETHSILVRICSKTTSETGETHTISNFSAKPWSALHASSSKCKISRAEVVEPSVGARISPPLRKASIVFSMKNSSPHVRATCCMFKFEFLF